MTIKISSGAKPDSNYITLFVYGTLLSGEPNHYILSTSKFLTNAQTKPEFELLDINGQCPAMVAGGKTVVKGELYSLNKKTLAIIDRLEGHPQFYKRISISLFDDRIVQTYIINNIKIDKYLRIIDGDWQKWTKDKFNKDSFI